MHVKTAQKQVHVRDICMGINYSHCNKQVKHKGKVKKYEKVHGHARKKETPVVKELDDTTYNRLWKMKGFSQAYHFWKESRRAQSMAINSYVTYVTLPWHQIITDLLEYRQHPVLTF